MEIFSRVGTWEFFGKMSSRRQKKMVKGVKKLREMRKDQFRTKVVFHVFPVLIDGLFRRSYIWGREGGQLRISPNLRAYRRGGGCELEIFPSPRAYRGMHTYIRGEGESSDSF